MSAVSSLPARRSVLATLAAAGAVGVVLLPSPQYAQTVPVTDAKAPVINPSSTRLPAATQAHAIRPFRINVPEAELADRRRRMAATRRPDREMVTDQFQGVQLAAIQALVHYWGTRLGSDH